VDGEYLRIFWRYSHECWSPVWLHGARLWSKWTLREQCAVVAAEFDGRMSHVCGCSKVKYRVRPEGLRTWKDVISISQAALFRQERVRRSIAAGGQEAQTSVYVRGLF
jgi:hypothetical protein